MSEPELHDGRLQPGRTEWNNYNVAQGILTYRQQVLLVGNDYGWPELAWSLPGGRLEPGEQHPAALRREVQEETGLAVEVGDLLFVVDARSEQDRRHFVTCVFELRLRYPATDQPTLECSADPAVREARWVPFERVTELIRRPSMGEGLVNYLYYGPQRMPYRYWSYPDYSSPNWRPLSWPPATGGEQVVR